MKFDLNIYTALWLHTHRSGDTKFKVLTWLVWLCRAQPLATFWPHLRSLSPLLLIPAPPFQFLQAGFSPQETALLPWDRLAPQTLCLQHALLLMKQPMSST